MAVLATRSCVRSLGAQDITQGPPEGTRSCSIRHLPAPAGKPPQVPLASPPSRSCPYPSPASRHGRRPRNVVSTADRTCPKTVTAARADQPARTRTLADHADPYPSHTPASATSPGFLSATATSGKGARPLNVTARTLNALRGPGCKPQLSAGTKLACP
jgi:hypothetical protein